MKKLENNIWNIFYLITFTSFLAFVALIYIDYKHLAKRVEFELETNLQLVANSLSYKLAEQELLLESVGQELIKSTKSDAEKQNYLDTLLKKNSSLAAFGLFDKDVKFLVTTSNVNVKRGAPLIHNESLKHSLAQTLNSQNMIIGETILFQPLGRWVVPLRKALYGENGELLGVMSTGFINEKNKNFLDKLQLLNKNNIVIIKDKNYKGEFFRQYASGFDDVSEEDLYSKAMDNNFFKDIERKIYKKHQLTIDEMRKKKIVATMEHTDFEGRSHYIAISYNQKYKLWVLIKQSKTQLMERLGRNMFIYFSIYVILFLLLYWLFRRLVKAESQNKNALVFQAEHDELTLLPNRKYMYKHIKEWMKINDREFYVLYLDLDNFKNINDKFGHTIGDKILQEVAKRLESFFSPKDMLIRQGGDEFIVFLTREYKKGLEALSKSLIQKVSEVYVIENNEFRIGISLGIASYPKDSRDINELLSFADTAMYKAKQHKNYFAFFSEDMRHEALVRSDIEHELRGAIDADEFYMTYQPQISKEGKLYGVEALLRWKNSRLGLVSPADFIEVAEQTGVMDEIGDYVIEKSLHEIKALQDKTGLRFKLSVNISMVQFMESDFLEKLMASVAMSGFHKELLTLEVTESLSISEFDKIVPLLQSVRAEGIHVSLDDFGTGYSSLSVLRKLPISELKIDKSFIDEIEYNLNERKLVQSIIEIGKNFEMSTVAEGVESKEQLKILQELGCDIIQGYYYSKPLTIEQLHLYAQKEQTC